ncbi:hypothetical protein [Hymenobacter sp. UYP22]|uniref:hypothetical protein n=1 Tax=Hymenobacter sp. UYP22 TaxID=3156348 RepID=UPI003395702E
MRFATVSLLGAMLLATACQKEDNPVSPDAVIGPRWHNTFRPAQQGYSTYTPTNLAEAGWHYEVIQLHPDHTFVESGLGPADGPVDYPGTWQQLSTTTYRIQFLDPQRSGYVLRVKAVDADKMEARRE